MSKTLAKVGTIIAGVALIATGVGAALGGTMLFAGIASSTWMTVGAIISLTGGLLAGTPKAPSTTTRDRLYASLDPSTPRKIVFGRTAMATDVRYHAYTGTDQEYYEQILCVASHEVEAIEEIWFDTKKAWSVSGGVTSDYTGYLWVTPRLVGTRTNGIPIDSIWTADSTLTGCAYVHLKMKLTGNSKKAESPFSQSIPTRVTVRGKGAKLPDPRLSTSAGGSGSQSMSDQTTWAYTTAADSGRNPALELLWYLLGWRIQNPATGTWKLAVGRGIPPERLDLESFITAANLCDELVTKADLSTEPRYRGDGAFSEGDDPSLVISNLEAAMNGRLRDAGGKISLMIFHNDLATPVAHFTDDDILGEESWVPTPSIEQSFNVVRGRYTDPSDAALYQLVDAPETRLPSVDGIERIATFDDAVVQSPSQKQRLDKQRLQRAQYQGIYTAKFNARAWQASLGKVVTLSHSTLGWASKLFRVIGHGVAVNGVVPMTLQEEHSDIYQWDKEEAAAVAAAVPTSYDPLLAPLVQAIQEVQLSVQTEWSPDGSTSWGPYEAGDRWLRISTDGGATWGTPALAIGEDGDVGATGNLKQHVFKRSATAPATPTGDGIPTGWSDGPPVDDGNPLWMSTAEQTAAGVLVGVWSSPIRLDGEDGANAKTIRMTADRQIVTFDGDGVQSPASQDMTLTVHKQNTSAATSFTYADNLGTSNATLEAATNSAPNGRIVLDDIFAGTPTRLWVRVTATVTDGAAILTDTITLHRLDAGTDALTIVMPNEAHTLPSDAVSNAVTSWSGATGNVRVFAGVTDVTSLFTIATQANPQAVTMAYDNVANPRTYTASDAPTTAGYFNNASVNVATITIRATGSGIYTGKTLDKVFTLTKSRQGAVGPQGPQGDQGIQGPPGADGQTTYTWIAYANSADGATDFTTGGWNGHTYIGIANNKTTATESNASGDYTWSRIQGDQGVPGTPGADGVTTYTWFAYANDATGSTGFTTGNWTNQTYIGIATNKTTATESTNPADYTWSKIQGPTGPTGPQGPEGPQGEQGVQGPQGPAGTTYYTWIAYADSPDGTVNFTTGAPGTRRYIGVATGQTTATESTSAASYSWSQINGFDGAAPWRVQLTAAMSRSGPVITKSGGTADWDRAAYSAEKQVGAAISFSPNQVNAHLMVGLNGDPTTDAGYISIDYGWYCNANGVMEIWESNNNRGFFGAYTATDVFSIIHAGTNILYLKNGVVQRVVTGVSASLQLAFDTSFHTVGGAITLHTPILEDAIVVTPSVSSVNFALNADGSVKAGQLPKGILITAKKAGADVAITSMTGIVKQNCSASVSGSTISFTAISASEGYFLYDVVVEGQTHRIRVGFTTTQEGTVGSTSQRISLGVAAVSSTTYAQLGNTIGINASADGELRVSGSTDYTHTGTNLQNWRGEGKLQYRSAGGTWTDVAGSLTIGSFSSVDPETGTVLAGGVACPAVTLTGLTASAAYEVRFMFRKYDGSATTANTQNGTLYAEQV